MEDRGEYVLPDGKNGEGREETSPGRKIMINDFLCQIPDGYIRLDEYAMNNAICCPLRLSLLNESGNKVGEIECNTNEGRWLCSGN